jgi:hypothetical protein
MGMSVNEFRRRSLGYIQQFLPPDSKWRGVSLDGCMSDALNVIEPQIINEARLTAANPRWLAHTPAARLDTLDPNMRMVSMNQGGMEVHTFHGESFVKALSRPGRRVVSFNTPSGPMRPDGTFYR